MKYALLLIFLLWVCSTLSVILMKLGYLMFYTLNPVKWALNPVIMLSLIFGLLGKFLSYLLLKYYNAGIVALIGAGSYVFILLSCYFILHETLTIKQIIGAFLIISGIYMVV